MFASVYSPQARGYFDAIDYKIEEERMAVVIQEMVVNAYEERYYPHISGVGQSYNFYPFSYIQPEDGVAMLAVGLGNYVVGGERSFRFCPKYPRLEILSPEDQVQNTQRMFYALDLRRNTVDLFNGEDATLVKHEIAQAEKDGTLCHCASIWSAADQRLVAGLEGRGPRALNFANILQYDVFPLADVLRVVLEMVEDAMETQVEIEFAVDLAPGRRGNPTFYLLQIKHLLRDQEDCTISIKDIKEDEILLYSSSGMGNGLVEGIKDVVWVDPDLFERSETPKIAAEVAAINERLRREGHKYVLMGPGRWGTRDPWLGIPITWPQISYAQVVVEYALPEFQVDASLGSHFFHNVTSLNVGYFTVAYGSAVEDRIMWDWLRTQTVREKTDHLVWTTLAEPMRIMMDGRKGISAIFRPGCGPVKDPNAVP